ncbi:MAG: ribonuclease J, partial [Sulfurimonas sp.]|uniref:MBL fold metallo-hydrolase n=1 Tax=Sulfurimonas sp. TaxID=2022749 RepID=UPI0039E4CA0C
MEEENKEVSVSKPERGNSQPLEKNVNGNKKPQHNNGNRKPNQNKSNSDKVTGTKPNNNNNNKNKNRNRHRRQPTPVDENLKSFVVKNQEAHKQRLNPHYKLDLNSNAKIRVTPLGGLGEIGGNIMVVETEKEAILIDVGMSFPDADMHGVDILIPDFAYLREIKNKIVGVVITHAHEDHIGAMPYLYKEMQFPIFGTPLPLAMIGTKFDEHHIKEHRKYFNPIEKRQIIKI